MVKEISSNSQFQSEIAGPALSVVDFYATWCGPCRQIAPFIEQLAVKYPQVKFLKVDVDKNQDISQNCRVTAMPTFIFFKDGKQVDMQRGADPGALEAKVIAHKVEVNPFANSKGHSLSAGAAVPPAGSSREARLAAFGHIDVKKASAPPIAPSPAPVTKAPVPVLKSEAEEEEEALAKAIALSMAEGEATSSQSNLRPGDEVVDDLVPVPVNLEVLSQLADMGFSDVRGRKAIVHGQNLEGALAWLEEHQGDADIDQPYLVKREDAERRDASGNLKPLTEEERAAKVVELQEKAKRIRAEKEKKAKEEEIKREKERRERGKMIDTVSEEREKLLKKHELAKAKKEKEDAKKEKERLLAEIARDKEIRRRNNGVMPSVLGVDGYNPSSVQYDQPGPTSSTPQPKAVETPSATAPSDPPASKKQAIATKPALAKAPESASPEQQVDTAITLIAKYRLGGDGGNALRLLITFLKNLVEHPDEAKFRSINMESNAFKSKLAPFLGPLNLLLAVGFEKINEDNVDKLKYNAASVESIVPNTLAKLVEAEALYRRMNP